MKGERSTLAARIDATLNGKPMSFYALAQALYPDGRSWRYQANGGPPGCYMALSAGIRRGGFPDVPKGIGPANRTIYPRHTGESQQ